MRIVDECVFGWFAGCFAFIGVEFRVGAERHTVRKQVFVIREMLHNGHLVLGESARLVRADNLRATERFHGGEFADYRIALGHIRHAD